MDASLKLASFLSYVIPTGKDKMISRLFVKNWLSNKSIYGSIQLVPENK
jgi:hypothetical protein